MFTKKVTIKDRIELWSYLAHLSQNAIPLIQSLSMIRSLLKNETLIKIVDQIISALTQGDSLSQALGAYPKIFSSEMVHLLHVAEQTGGYAAIFSRLEEQDKWRFGLQQLVRQSLRYPLILFLSMIVFMTVLMEWLIPNMVEYLKLIHSDQLPFVSVSLIFVTNHLSEFGYMLLAGGIGCWGWSWYRHVHSQKPLRYFVPILGKLLYQIQVLNFGYHLGLLLKARIDVLGALFYAADSLSCPWLKKKIKIQEAYLIQGEALSHVLSPLLGENFILSKIMCIGEKTGQLDELLLTTTSYELQQVQQRLKDMLEFLQPLMIITMGVLLGWTILAILLPLYGNVGGFHG